MHPVQAGTHFARGRRRDDRLLDTLAEDAIENLGEPSLTRFNGDVTGTHEDSSVDQAPGDRFHGSVTRVSFALLDLVLVVKYANDLPCCALPFTNDVIVVFKSALEVEHGVHCPSIRSYNACDRLVSSQYRRIAVLERDRDTSMLELKVLSG